jgi:hypothetical protein
LLHFHPLFIARLKNRLINPLSFQHLHNEPDSIDYAVRKSLKGEAGRVVMHLGPTASIPEILYKLDSIYGDVEKKVDLLGDFLSLLYLP